MSQKIDNAVNAKLQELEPEQGGSDPGVVMVTVRMSIEERDALNMDSRDRRISLNNHCRDLLGLPANTKPARVIRGNPKWRRENALQSA